MKEAIKMLEQAVIQIAKSCVDDIPAEDLFFLQVGTIRHVAEWLAEETSVDLEDAYMNIIINMVD